MKGTFSFFLLPLIFAPLVASQTPQGEAASEKQWRMENDAGVSALDQGRYADAVRSFQSAIRSAEAPAWANQKMAESLNGLAQAYFRLGNYAAAEHHFQQSLEILEKTLAPDNPNVAMVLGSLATVYRLRENYTAATPMSRRSLAILEKAYGPDHPNVLVALNNLAVNLRLHGDYDEAKPLLQRSLSILERQVGPEHPNVAVTLNNLVLIHSLQGDYLDAEPLARRSLSIFEKAPAREKSNLLQSLENLAGICLESGKYDESEQLYRRALSIRWGASTDGVVLILEQLANVLNLAAFDQPRKEALRAFQKTPGWDALGANQYIVMAQALQARGLLAEAEDVLARAVQAFPKSLEARYELANAYALAQRWAAALHTLEDAVRIEVSNPAGDGPTRSAFYQKIARMNVLLVQFDDAQSAFKTALELNPTNVRALVAAGDLYLQLDRPDDAATEYARAILVSGENAPAYRGMADVNLRLRRFSEAVTAADKALEIDSTDAQSSYVRAVALLRSGHAKEGEAELDRFRKLERQERERADWLRTTRVFLQSAADNLANGRGDDAIKELRDGIREYPDAGLLHLNLGIIQSRLGRHSDAVETFQTMIKLGLGDFYLVHFNLSHEYQVLGNMALSQRHRLIYLQKYNSSFPNQSR